jgi:phosphoglycolate phosphatase
MHLIIFDVDGTLVDSQNVIVTAMAQALQRNGLDVPERARVLSIVGLSLPVAVRTLLPAAAPDRLEAVAEDYKAAFAALRAHPDHYEPLFKGAGDTLAELAACDNVVLGLATGKSRRGVDGLFVRHGIGHYFATIQTSDTSPSKPHPDMIERAMRETGVEPARTVMIGDTTFDLEMARNAGVAAIGVAWGYHPVAALAAAGAAAIVDDFAALRSAIGQLIEDR